MVRVRELRDTGRHEEQQVAWMGAEEVETGEAPRGRPPVLGQVLR